jgi:prefoldin beta subunit
MKDKNRQIQEMQILEQSIHQILLQKQAFQMELSETQAALRELEKSGDDVFKIVGQLMIKAKKSDIKEELLSKEKILKLRADNLDKQEDSLSKKMEEIRNSVLESDKE